MKKTLARWAMAVWYGDSMLASMLYPISIGFSALVKLRKFLYRTGVLKSHSLPVPVIVVGNITVGGTGKTPLIIWLADLLKKTNYRPGIISRGYGGQSTSWPQWVDGKSDASQVGDEPLLIAKKTGCPMSVSPSRVEAAEFLLCQSDCNVILSDDGLQHYALNRDIEIAVIDAERRFGNNYCLPAGPLREPISRLQSVDFVVVNGEKSSKPEFTMKLIGDHAVNLHTGVKKKLAEFHDKHCHALAGIGNPERFFKLLKNAGLIISPHSFPDHYFYERHDIDFGDDKPVLMTEKDAVKCGTLASEQHWYVPIQAVLEPDFTQRLLDLLREKYDRRKIA